MTNNRRFAAAVFSCLLASGPAWAGIGFGQGESLDALEFLSEAGAGNAPDLPRMILASHTGEKTGKPGTPVEFLPIPGGKFRMGADDGLSNARPVHEVTVADFEMSKSVVTVEQYAECVFQGRCTEPLAGDFRNDCNWRRPGRELYPVNCVNWEQANQYAEFKGARLPSEAEWEYARKNAGKGLDSVRGEEESAGDTAPVCSNAAGNTAQGLCDMAGNVRQWVQDDYRDSYADAPADGSAFEAGGSLGVIRGGSFLDEEAEESRADFRYGVDFAYQFGGVGFRLARSSRGPACQATPD